MLREAKVGLDTPSSAPRTFFGTSLPLPSPPCAHPPAGVSRRIWLLVAVVLGIFTFSRLLFRTPFPRPARPVQLTCPAASHDPLASLGVGLLTSKDYLNASAADPAPFDFCPVFGPGDEVAARRGQWGLLRSRLHMGSGARVQRVVQKAMAGLPVTISVLGGSGGFFGVSRVVSVRSPADSDP